MSSTTSNSDDDDDNCYNTNYDNDDYGAVAYHDDNRHIYLSLIWFEQMSYSTRQKNLKL